MKAYRQDFIAIASLMTGGNPARLTVVDITKDSMRHAFAAYARDHEAASIRRCWSTWNVLCKFLYTAEQLAANPMQLVGRPKLAKPLPRALPRAPTTRRRCVRLVAFMGCAVPRSPLNNDRFWGGRSADKAVVAA